MEGLGIRELFIVIVGADLVENSKPAPDLILLASKVAGYQSADCMYVGDQLTDMKASKNANVSFSIGVRNPELIQLADEVLKLVRDIQIIN